MPSQNSISHRQAIALWLEVNLFVGRVLHGCYQGGAGMGTRPLFCGESIKFGESIERFRKELVNIVKTAASDSLPHTPFQLGLMDFDFGAMPSATRS